MAAGGILDLILMYMWVLSPPYFIALCIAPQKAVALAPAQYCNYELQHCAAAAQYWNYNSTTALDSNPVLQNPYTLHQAAYACCCPWPRRTHAHAPAPPRLQPRTCVNNCGILHSAPHRRTHARSPFQTVCSCWLLNPYFRMVLQLVQ